MKRPEEWTNAELAKQCIMPRLDTDKFFSDKEYEKQINQLAADGIVGFCVFGGTMDKVAKMTELLQLSASIPLLFSSDFEHGLPMRLEDGTSFPHALALGINNKPEDTFKIAKAIATECKSIGIHWNFAPVCDVNSNPKNPIINIRSFGTEPEVVCRHSEKYIAGLQGEGIIACAKHFPGHGDTSVDSHIELPIINKTEDELAEPELTPFINAINCGVKSIMAAHIALPKIDSSGLPASLSPVLITDLLRTKFAFNGLVVTDALDMKAISDNYPNGKASLMCIEAGADIALIPPDTEESIRAISEEANINPVFRQKLIISVKRIIDAKRKANLFTSGMVLNQEKMQYFPSHEKLALKAATGAVSINGNKELLPIKEDSQIACYAVLQTQDIDQASRFFNILSQAIENDMDFGYIDSEIKSEQINEFAEMTKDADVVIFAYFYRARAYQGSITIDEELKSKLRTLSMGKKVISLLFGNPYLEKEIESNANITLYSDSVASLAASVLALSGKKIEFDAL